jgi:predicted ArsR family transcriptional regulator
VETTRTKILDILRKRREATIDDLTHALQLAPATIRRHLDILQRDGYVSVRPVRRETGRPHYAFSLTQAGEALFPQHYIRTTNALIEEMLALGPQDTEGKSGKEIASIVFERMADRLARSYAPRVTAARLGERVEQAADALASEGIIFEVEPVEAGYVLWGRGCPCRRLAEKHPEVCGHDRALLARLIGAEVEPADAASGAFCAYLVRGPAPSRAARP